VLAYLSTLFPAHDNATWAYLQDQFARHDPTMVHTFDVFMRMTELAQNFTPEQMEERAERLSRIDIFRQVSLADLENLSRAIEVAHYEDGAMLFDKGDDGDAMYLIESGAIAVYAIDSSHREKPLRTFGVGQVVGDFAVLDGEKRSARARSEGALSVLVLRREVFQMFIQSRPQVILAVLAVLAERARYTTRTVESTVQSLSSIAQGEYERAHPVPVSSAPPPEKRLPTEMPNDMTLRLTGALVRLTAELQATAGASAQ
jgi:CRP-like cAMP-binding protein